MVNESNIHIILILANFTYFLFSKIFEKVEKYSRKVDAGTANGTEKVLLHFPGLSVDEKKGQWYLDNSKIDELLKASTVGVVPPGDWQDDELNDDLLPLPVIQTEDSLDADGPHYYWGQPNLSKQEGTVSTFEKKNASIFS